MIDRTAAVAVDNVSKSFSRRHVLRDVSFSVGQGEVVGLLGPNGAGKSTSMKILTGLLKADSGSARVFDRRFDELERPFATAGIMIEPSWLDPSLTGVQTLIASSYASGVHLAKRQAFAALEPFGLAEAGARRVGSYSLGMRQRLALCRSMRKSVSLLVLDEPSNGLDVDGVTRLREMLRIFASEGGSVLLSSHLMSEMQLIADRAVVLSAGYTAGTIDLREDSYDSSVSLVSVSEGADEFISAVKAASIGFEQVDGGSSGWRLSANTSDVFKLAVEAGATLSDLRVAERSLEDRYNNLIGREAGLSHR